jgi:hypothetical protein
MHFCIPAEVWVCYFLARLLGVALADETIELCRKLLACEGPDEFHARAMELRAAIRRRVQLLR